MVENISPKQALFLWNLILTSGGEDEGVKWGDTKPRLTPAERQALVDADYVEVTKRGAGKMLTTTERAWSWAEKADPVVLLKSRSALGATVLEALLNRLLPLLRQREIGLSELFPREEAPKSAAAASASSSPQSLPERIEATCLSLTSGARQTRVKLLDLRRGLPDVPRPALDRALLELQRKKKLVLYREDNSAALRTEDRDAALLVGNEPRHLVLLEA